MIEKLRTFLRVGLLGLVAVVLPNAASGHGYITDSRSHLCAQRQNSGCGAIIYEPQSVEGPDRFPASGPPDGRIASADNGRFRELDEQTPSRWKTTPIDAGTNDFVWTFTANHATRDFRYFITKPDWNPSLPLSRDAFDLMPFCEFPGNNQRPPSPLVHTCDVPGGRSGYHIILGVWDVGDTAASFYQVVDVRFSGESPPPNDPWVDVGAISASTDLNLGDRVFTRVFDNDGEINDPSLQTSFTVGSLADGDRLMWPFRLAELINEEQSDLRAGIKNADGTINPVSGDNDIFAKDGSGITRVEISIEEAPPEEPFLSLENVASEYEFEDGQSVAVDFTVTAEPDFNLLIEIFSSSGELVAVANSDSSVTEHSVTVDQPVEGTYSLVVKLLSGSEFIRQESATFDLVLAPQVNDAYDYVYPESISAYSGGTRVLGTDGNIYECKPWPYSGWCSGSGTYYAPGTGLAWREAWSLIGPLTGAPLPQPTPQHTYPAGRGSYQHGTLVVGSNQSVYRCLVPNWCNGHPMYFSPGRGYAWSIAWGLAY